MQHKRALPFREDKNPYKIWVSEVMLQQTRVNAMLPSFEKFISKFPTVESLAKSKEEEVLAYWKGLGYYSRALNLRKGAIYLVNNFMGKFPRQLEEMLLIPGIGPYTARAILSIAFDERHAVLDGNVKRVLARLFAYKKDISHSTNQKELQALADGYLNEKNPGDHNQAMMELGATVCTTNPNCLICPTQKDCLAFARGEQTKLPISKKKENKIPLEMVFVLMEKGKQVLLEKNTQRRFFKKIYTLPFFLQGENLPKDYEWVPEYLQNLLKNRYTIHKTGKKHSITHHDIQLSYIRIPWDGNPIEGNTKWVSLNDLTNEFPSSIAKKLNLSFLNKLPALKRLTRSNVVDNAKRTDIQKYDTNFNDV